MAILFKSRGTVGPSSRDSGTALPLEVIDHRLKDFRVFYHGEEPKTMLPQTRDSYMHVLIEVLQEDLHPSLERFPRPGFYQVVGLRPRDADFLFDPV